MSTKFNESTTITSAITTADLAIDALTDAARLLVNRAMVEIEKPSELRDSIRADLAKHVRKAAELVPSVAKRGYNCVERGDSRYSAESDLPLHFVKPTGGIDLGKKVESQVQLALRSLKLRYKSDMSKWLGASIENQFKPVKDAEKDGADKTPKTQKATKQVDALAAEVAEVIKTLGLSRAETLAWLATAATFKKAA
jgi:hypothetical protein